MIKSLDHNHQFIYFEGEQDGGEAAYWKDRLAHKECLVCGKKKAWYAWHERQLDKR